MLILFYSLHVVGIISEIIDRKRIDTGCPGVQLCSPTKPHCATAANHPQMSILHCMSCSEIFQSNATCLSHLTGEITQKLKLKAINVLELKVDSNKGVWKKSMKLRREGKFLILENNPSTQGHIFAIISKRRNIVIKFRGRSINPSPTPTLVQTTTIAPSSPTTATNVTPIMITTTTTTTATTTTTTTTTRTTTTTTTTATGGKTTRTTTISIPPSSNTPFLPTTIIPTTSPSRGTSTAETPPPHHGQSLIVIILPTLFGLFVIILLAYCIFKKRQNFTKVWDDTISMSTINDETIPNPHAMMDDAILTTDHNNMDDVILTELSTMDDTTKEEVILHVVNDC